MARPSTTRKAKNIQNAIATALAVVHTAHVARISPSTRPRGRWSASQPPGTSANSPAMAAAVAIAPAHVSEKPHSSWSRGSAPITTLASAPSTMFTAVRTQAGRHP